MTFLVELVREDGGAGRDGPCRPGPREPVHVGQAGDVAVVATGGPAFREVAGLDWDVAPLPVGREASTILHSDGFCLARGGDHLDEATQFIAFAGGPTGQGILALGGRTVPSSRSVATGAFLDPAQAPEHDQVFLDGIAVMRRTPVLPTWPEIEDVAAEILTRAFYEPGYSIDDAITDIDNQARALFEGVVRLIAVEVSGLTKLSGRRGRPPVLALDGLDLAVAHG